MHMVHIMLLCTMSNRLRVVDKSKVWTLFKKVNFPWSFWKWIHYIWAALEVLFQINDFALLESQDRKQ